MNKMKKLSAILLSLASALLLWLGVAFGTAEKAHAEPVGATEATYVCQLHERANPEKSYRFKSVQAAIDYLLAPEGEAYEDHVDLLTKTTESIKIPADFTEAKPLTLNLGGYTLTNNEGKHTIENYGYLTIVAGDAGEVDNVSHGHGAVVNYGAVTLNGGTFTRSAEKGTYEPYSANGNSWYVLLNEGDMTINANVSVNIKDAAGGYSSLIANNVDCKAENPATLTILNGTFSGGINTVKNDEAGILTIKGGTFKNTIQHVVQNWSQATISGGTFELNNANVAIATGKWSSGTPSEKVETIITDGEFHGAVAIVGGAGGYTDETVTYSVSGGKFSKVPAEEFFAEGYSYIVDESGMATVGTVANVDAATVVCVDGVAYSYTHGEATWVAQIGEKSYYTTLQNAIEAAEERGTVKLLKDVTDLATTLTIDKSLTLDLNGHKITAAETVKTAIYISGNDVEVTITSTTTDKGKIEVATSNERATLAISIDYNTTVKKLTVNNIAISAPDYVCPDVIDATRVLPGPWGIQADGNCETIVTNSTIGSEDKPVYLGIVIFGNGSPKLTVESTKIYGVNAAIQGNGSFHGTDITLKDSTLSSKLTTVYNPQNGNLTVEGGTITGATGIEMRAGTLTVKGNATITSNADKYEVKANGSGGTVIGAAIAVSQHTTNKEISVTIEDGVTLNGGENGKAFVQVDTVTPDKLDDARTSVTLKINGGTFNGEVLVGETLNGVEARPVEEVTGFISGGTFSELPAEECLNGEHTFVQETDGTYSALTYDEAVSAKSIVAVTGGLGYTKLEDAIAAAAPVATVKVATVKVATVKLIADLTVDAPITIGAEAELTLDFNGHTATYNGNDTTTRVFQIYGNLTVNNGADNATEEGKGGVTVTDPLCWGVFDQRGGNLTINGGYFRSCGEGIPTSGSLVRVRDKANVTIKNGSFVVKGFGDKKAYDGALYNDGEGTITIIGGYFYTTSDSTCNDDDDNYQYCVKSLNGKLIIKGGTIIGCQGAIAVTGGEAEIYNVTAEAREDLASGQTGKSFYALYVAGGARKVSCVVNGGTFISAYRATVLVGNSGDGGAKLPAECVINGGTFTSNGTADALEVDDTVGTASVKGGTFNVAPKAEYYAQNAYVYKDGNNVSVAMSAPEGETFMNVDGVNYSLDVVAEVTEAVAAIEVGGKLIGYTSLAEAVAAVPEKGAEPTTITLLRNAEGDGVVVNNKNIIFDLNTFTYDVTGKLVGSKGTEYIGFQLLRGTAEQKNANGEIVTGEYRTKVEFKNGTLKASNTSCRMLIQNYCYLTLTGVNLEGASHIGYVVSNNFGSMTVSGDTNITASAGKVAFDVYYWPNGGYGVTEGKAVEVIFDKNFTGTVTGKIEYGSDNTDTTDWQEKAALKVVDGATGTFDVTFSTYNLGSTKANINIAGGFFKGTLPDHEFLAEGYVLKEQEDGSFGVKSEADFQAKIGDIAYSTVNLAIAKANDGDTITLIKDVTLDNEGITIPAGKNVVLDLAGHTIGLTSTVSGTAAITNHGTATVQNGSIVRKSSSKDWYTIYNEGTLTLNCDVTSEHATGTSMIVNNQTCKAEGATLNIIGGNYETAATIAVKNDECGILNISDGTFTATNQSVQNWSVATITGGTFNSQVIGWNYEDSASTNVSTTIKGGTFNGAVWAINYGADGSQTKAYNGEGEPQLTISNGTFSTLPAAAYFAEGKIGTQNGDVYTVKAGSYVAMVGDRGYETLPEAIAAAPVGGTVKLIADVDTTTITDTAKQKIEISKDLTLDLNSHTITHNGKTTGLKVKLNVTATITSTATNADGTVKRGKIVNVTSMTDNQNKKYAVYSSGAKSVTISNVDVESKGYGIYISTAETVTLENCDIKAEGGAGIYIRGLANKANATTGEEYTPVAFKATNCNVDAGNKAYGSYVSGYVNATVSNCTITNAPYGMLDYTIGASVYNNCTITNCSYGAFIRDNGDVTLDGCTIGGEADTTTFYGIAVYGSEEEGKDGKTVIKDCNIVVNGAGITGNGTYPGTDITVTGTNITAAMSGIYHPQDGSLTVEGDTKITAGLAGIEMRAGTLIVNGATIESTATKYSVEANGSGSTVTGAAIAISQHSTNEPISVTINDATLTGDKALVQVDTVLDEKLEGPRTEVKLEVNGGTFNGAVETGLVAKDAEGNPIAGITQRTDEGITGFVKGGTFAVAPANAYYAQDAYVTKDATTGKTVVYNEKTKPADKEFVKVDGVYYEMDLALNEIGVVAKDSDGVGYTSLKTAISKASVGDTVTLLKDESLSEQIEVSRTSLTIDLGGFTVDGTGISVNGEGKPAVFLVSATRGTITFKHGTINATGIAIEKIGGKISPQGALTLASDLIINSVDTCVYIYKATVFTTEATLRSVNSAAILGNGTDTKNLTINVKGGSVTSEKSVAMYLPQQGGITTISGGTISGTTGIEVRNGTLNITGGTITATGTELKTAPNGSGSSVLSGAAVAVSKYANNSKTLSLNITGGELSGTYAVYEADLNTTGELDATKIVPVISGGMLNGKISSENKINFITGGSFSVLPDYTYFASGCSAHFDEEKGLYVVDEKPWVAAIGTVGYQTLAEAIEKAEAGDIVTLLCNDPVVHNSRAQILINKSLTLDLNGYTLKNSSNGIKVAASGADVTIKNGKVAASLVNQSQPLIVVSNVSNLLIQDVEIKAMSNFRGVYIEAGCSGNVTVKDTAITGARVGILNCGTGTLTVDGGSITSTVKTSMGVAGNGNAHGTTTVLNNVNISTYVGVYHPQDGTLTVNGGTITGVTTGIEMRSGSLTVTGGAEIAATATEYSAAANGSGTTVIGAAVAISQHTTNKKIDVKIDNATLTGVKALVQVDLETITGTVSDVTMSVAGGTFNGGIVSERCTGFIKGGSFSELPDYTFFAEGYSAKANEDGMYVTEEKPWTAAIGTTGYQTLQEAVTAAKEGEIVKLVAGVTEDLSLENLKKATLDLDGFTLTGNIFVTGCEWTIQNGNIVYNTDVSGGSAVAVSNANVTLSKVTITVNCGQAPTYNTEYGYWNYATVYGIKASVGSVLTITDCKINGNNIHQGVSVSGSQLTVNGLTMSGFAVYDEQYLNPEYPENEEVVGIIVAGLTGENTVANLTVSGAFAAMKTVGEPVTVDGDINATGCDYAIYDDAFDEETKLQITDGTIIGKVLSLSKGGFITGGTFSELPDYTYFAEGYSAKANEDGMYVTEEKPWAAAIGTVGYQTVQAAIVAAGTNETEITLLGNVTENIKVEKDQTVILNLNGFKLQNKEANEADKAKDTIVNYGTLTVKGEGTVDNVSNGKAAVANYGTVTLDGGTYIRSKENGQSATESGGNSYYVLFNQGTMTINAGVTVESTGHFSSLVENGWYNGNKNTAKTNAVLTINGGTFSGGINTVKNDDYGVMTINGGKFSNVSQFVVLNWNELTIKGGEFNMDGNAIGVVATGHLNTGFDEGTTTIMGGMFNGGLTFMNGNPEGVTYNVKGGTYTVTSLAELNLEELNIETGYVAYVAASTTFALRSGDIVVTVASVGDALAQKDNILLVGGKNNESLVEQGFKVHEYYIEVLIDDEYVIIDAAQYARIALDELQAHYDYLISHYEYSDGGKMDLDAIRVAGLKKIESYIDRHEFAKIDGALTAYKRAMDDVLTSVSYEKKLADTKKEYLIDLQAHATTNGVSMEEASVKAAVDVMNGEVQLSRLIDEKQAVLNAIDAVKAAMDAAAEFAAAKEAAKEEVRAYAAEKNVAVTDAELADIEAATTPEEVEAAVTAAKTAIDNLAEALADTKVEAFGEGVVNGKTVVFDGVVLKESTNPQGITAYWVGAKVTAPAYVTADTVANATYSNDGGETWKAFADSKDGNYFMEVWGKITPEFVANAQANGGHLYYSWKFDWNNDGLIDDVVTIDVNANTVVLFNDYQKAAVTEVNAYAAANEVELTEALTKAVTDATTVEAIDEAVAAAKAYVDAQVAAAELAAAVAQAKLEATEYVKLYAAAMNVAYTTELDASINNAEITTLEGVAAAKANAIKAIDEAKATADATAAELANAKKEAIVAIQAAAQATEADAAVVVPTATLAAINAAVDLAQVEEFKVNALAEIADIRAFRKQIDELGTNGEEVLEAIKAFREALLGDGTNAGKLAETEKALKAYLDSVETNINKWTSDELTEAQNYLDDAITTAKEELNNAIESLSDTMTTKIDEILDTFTTAVEDLGIALDERDEKLMEELGFINDDLATLSDDLYSNYSDLYDMLAEAQSGIEAANSTLETIADTVSTMVDDILTSDAFLALATEENVNAVKTDVSNLHDALLNGETGALVTLENNLKDAIDGVKSVVDNIVTTLADMGVQVTDIQTKVNEIKTTDLPNVVTELGKVKTAIEGKIAEVKGVVDDISKALTAVGTDVTEINTAVKAIKETDLPAVATQIENAQKAVTDAINSVKTDVGNVAEALTAVGVDVTTIKNAVNAIRTEDLKTVTDKLGAVQTAIEKAVADAKTALNDQLTSLTGDLDTLTGRLEDINKELLRVVGELDAHIAALGTVNHDALAAKLAELKAKIDEIADKVHAAVGVEAEKTKAAEDINKILNDLLAGETTRARSLAARLADEPAPAVGTMTPAQREKLYEMYSPKMAALVEQYYNEAMAAVNNATTAEAAQNAATNFKRNVDTAKMIDSIDTKNDLGGVYAMLVIATVISAAALVLVIVLLLKKKQAVAVTPDGGSDGTDDNQIAVATVAEEESAVEEEPAAEEPAAEEEPVETEEAPSEETDEVSEEEPREAEESEESEEESDDESEEDENDDDDDDGDVLLAGDLGENDAFAFSKRPYRPFELRLRQVPEETLNVYSEIKNELCSYKKVKSRISKKCESFRIGRQLVAKITIVGKSLRLYLALNPADYDPEKFRHADKSDKKSYALVPMMVKVKGPRATKRAKLLVADCMRDVNRNDKYVQVDYVGQVRQQAAEAAAAEAAAKQAEGEDGAQA